MNVVEWPKEVLPTERLYGKQTGYVDNIIKTEYDSGRITSIMKNSVQKRVYSVNYAATKEQAKAFDNWFRNVLGGISGTFTALSLEDDGTTCEYRMTQNPQISGNAIKEISMQWQEV